ncbi:MAG: hypothetical protein WC378_02490 [Opitutaceae bacterium]|jgi:hypothetical protein
MSAIKVHLEAAELSAVRRLAGELDVKPEDIAYAALNRLMLQSEEEEVRKDILDTRGWRGENLPQWSDSAGAIHAYESMPDEEPQPRVKHVKDPGEIIGG